MTDYATHTNLTEDDKACLRTCLCNLLRKRRQLVTWPLKPGETPRLWWPEKTYEQLKSLEEFSEAYSRFSPLILRGVDVKLVSHNIAIYGENLKRWKDIDQHKFCHDGGDIHNRFMVWVEEALIIHTWNTQLEQLLKLLLSKSSTWPQLRVQFPKFMPALGSALKTDELSPALKRVCHMLGEPGRVSRANSSTGEGYTDIKRFGAGYLFMVKQAGALPEPENGRGLTWFLT